MYKKINESIRRDIGVNEA